MYRYDHTCVVYKDYTRVYRLEPIISSTLYTLESIDSIYKLVSIDDSLLDSSQVCRLKSIDSSV